MSQEANYFYLNRPQMLAWLVNANKEYHILGRGTGKSSRILARRTINNVFQMPRASGLNIGDTYARQLTRTLPALIGGWAAMGYKRDTHYVIGRRPPPAWRWPDPLEPPVDYKYYISWYNGSGIHIGSLDVDGSTIGLNIQYIVGDEAKKLNKLQLDEEVRPSMRSYRERFGNLAEYRSECYTTSMPVKADEMWILEYVKHYDPELVKLILEMSMGLELGKFKEAEAKKIEECLRNLRRKCTFYQEASSLENYAILGKDYFDDLYRSLGAMSFNSEILNMKRGTISGAYYPTFNVNHHTRKAKWNLEYLKNLGYDFDKIRAADCRQDGDLLPKDQLKISIDWGGHMNYLLVMKRNGMLCTILNEIFTKPPEHIDHLAEKFARYYWHHGNKNLVFRYDVSGDNVKDNSNLTSAEQFVKKLLEIDNRWNVQWQEKHVAPTQHDKYHIGVAVFDEARPDVPRFIIIEDKCPGLITSILNAPVKENRKGMLEKNKSSETKHEKIDPLHATHASDAMDIHINAECTDLLMPDDYYIGF